MLTIDSLLKSRELEGNRNNYNSHEQLQALYSQLQLENILESHNGCVNTLSWNRNGTLLLTGSDDRKVIFWKYPSGTIQTVVGTGHLNNIFSARLIPENEAVLVTCSGDSTMKVYDVGQSSVALRKSFTCHSRSVKKIAFENLNPYVILSSSEDGTVRHHDLRVPHTCDNHCQNLLVELNYSINSVSASPILPFYFAVGGYDPHVRLFDRRFVPDSNHENSAVRKMRPEYSVSRLVTAVKFGNTSHEIIANYHQDAVYLWATDKMDADSSTRKLAMAAFEDEVEKIERMHEDGVREFQKEHFSQAIEMFQAILSIGEKQPFKTDRNLLAMMYCNLALCLLREGRYIDVIEALRLSKQARELNPSSIRAIVLCALAFYRLEKVQTAIELVEEYDSVLIKQLHEIITKSPVSEYELQKYIIGLQIEYDFHNTRSKILTSKRESFDRAYRGCINIRTIKDVNYVGDNFITSGSDDGSFFIWNKLTSEVVFIGKSDRSVVNCVEPHPNQPVVAVSGIDNTVKLWSPMSNENHRKYHPIPKEDWHYVIEDAQHERYSPGMRVICPVQ